MAGESSLLAQSNPSASTLTDILTVAGIAAEVDDIIITNQGSTTALVRLAIAPTGAAVAAEQYILYGESLGPGRTLHVEFRRPLRIPVGGILRGFADSASVSFNVVGA